MKKFNEISEETRAMEWLDKKRKDYNLNGEDLHYLNILYYWITNLQQSLKDMLDINLENDKELTNLQQINDNLTTSLNKKIEEEINLQQENERLKEIIKENTILVKDEDGNYQECNINPLDYKSRCEKAIKYINCNKQKTICAYGDNEDDDFEICLWEEDIDNLLNILQNGSDSE